MKGAIIQLATGELKRVEDLQTQDFVRSAEVSGGLKIDSSTVVDIQESQWPGFVLLHFVVGEQQSKVSIEVPPSTPSSYMARVGPPAALGGLHSSSLCPVIGYRWEMSASLSVYRA